MCACVCEVLSFFPLFHTCHLQSSKSLWLLSCYFFLSQPCCVFSTFCFSFVLLPMQTRFWKMLCVFSFHLFPTCCQFMFHFFWLTWHILLAYSFKSYFKNVIYHLFAYILHLLRDNIFFWWSLVIFHILLFLFELFFYSIFV